MSTAKSDATGYPVARAEVTDMTLSSTTRIPTTHGSRYIQRLCKHWSHNLAVEFTPLTGAVIFPRDARGADWPGEARLFLQAHADNLECRLEASAAGQLEALKDAVASHLDRFAVKEGALHFDWQDA